LGPEMDVSSSCFHRLCDGTDGTYININANANYEYAD